MRPQQQNRRMRGRGGGGGGGNNNNIGGRKGPNPLSRNYESNGPDVKIRGSAQQIAEKYATLARDAQSSGDRVMAENYLQHAEHYNRIIAAAQAQFAPQQAQAPREDFDDDFEGGYGLEGGGELPASAQPQHHHQQAQQPSHPSAQQQPAQHINGAGPQPIIEGMPAEVALNNDNPGQQSGGGRYRRRFENRNQNGGGQGRADGEQPSIQPESSAQPAEAPVAAEAQPQVAEEAQQERPRRARRPRRPKGEQEGATEASSEGGAESGGEPAAVAAEA